MRLTLLLFLCVKLGPAFAQEHTASAQVSTFELAAPQLSATKKIWIWLPKDYAKTTRRYPVLYMHDAQNLFDAKTSFVGEWNVDETLDSLNAKVIVVGIEHGNEKRIDELTPFPNAKYGGGKADAYLDFIVSTLKPEIDARYRTRTNAKNTGIMGSSLGGLVSFYALLKYPQTFGKAGVFSPSFWFSDEIYTFADSFGKIKGKVYVLYGTDEGEEMQPSVERMAKLLDYKRCDCLKLTKLVEVKGGRHNEKLWREGFAKAFKWLY